MKYWTYQNKSRKTRMRNVVTDSCVNYLGGGGMTLSHLAGWNSMQYGWRENCDLGGGGGKLWFAPVRREGTWRRSGWQLGTEASLSWEQPAVARTGDCRNTRASKHPSTAIQKCYQVLSTCYSPWSQSMLQHCTGETEVFFYLSNHLYLLISCLKVFLESALSTQMTFYNTIYNISFYNLLYKLASNYILRL